MMTPEEREILHDAGELWNKFILLPPEHPDDQNDVRFHVHAIQNIILARSAMRENYQPIPNDQP